MTKETILSGLIGIRHIRYVPVYKQGEIQVYDVYYKGQWLGSRGTIKSCRYLVWFYVRQHEIHSDV